MKGVDYAKALAKERDYYQDTIKRDRANSEKRIDENEKRHSEVQKKLSNNYDTDRADLESKYQKNLENMREKTEVSLDNKNQRYNKALAEEKDRFSNISENQRKDFDGRLKTIRDSYDRSLNSEAKANEEGRTAMKEQYRKNVDNITKDRDKQVGEYRDRMIGSGANLKGQYSKEKEQLVRAHEEQLQDTYQREATKRFQMKEGLAKDIDKIRDTSKSDNDQIRQHSREKIQRLQKNFDDRSNQLAGEYAERNKNMTESQRQDNLKANKEHQAEVMEARREGTRELQKVVNEQRRRDNGSGEFSEVIKRQQGLKDENIYEKKIGHLKDSLRQEQENYRVRREGDQEKYLATHKSESVDAANRLEKTEKELRADKIVNVANEREKAQRNIVSLEHKNKVQQDMYENQLNLERQSSSEKLNKLKDDFNKSLRSMEEQQKVFLSETRKQNADDKVKFSNEQSIQRNEEVFDLRRNFNKLMSSTTQDYEQRLENLARENNQLRDALDHKVSTVMEEADRQVRLQQQLYNEKRIADEKSATILMDQREGDLKNKITMLTGNFQRKMDSQSNTYEMRIKQMTNEYEGKIKSMTAAQLKELNDRDQAHNDEMKRLRGALEQEKAQLIAQYENQMNQMKIAHKNQVDQLNEYNKIS